MKKLFLTIMPVVASITLLFTSCNKEDGLFNSSFAMNTPGFSLEEKIVWDGSTNTLTTDLVAGKYTKVGEVKVTSNGAYLTIAYDITKPGWLISETHLSVTSSLTDVPGYDPEGGNPMIGNFNYNSSNDPFTDFVEYKEIPITSTPMYILAHAVVNQDITSVASMVLPTTAIMTLVTPGVDRKSTFTITLSNDGILNGSHPGWCVDLDNQIFPGSTSIYHVNILSSYDPDFNDPILIEKPENMDLVNWILNQDYVGKIANDGYKFHFYDVQRAIWTLLEDNTVPPRGGSSDTRVNQIVEEAIDEGEGFIPGCGGVFAIFLVPYDPTGLRETPVAQVTIITFPVECNWGGDETAWGAGYDFGGDSWAMYFTYPK